MNTHKPFFKFGWKFVRRTLIVITLLAIVGMSYHIRITTWKKQEAKTGHHLIFTLESALLFRYARLSLENNIPVHDTKIEYPDGLDSDKYFSIGGGVLFGKAYKLFIKLINQDISFERFYRYGAPAYFVMISVPMVFWIGYMFSSNAFLALIMAFWYGVCIPSVIRSTGQEFMRENFALPLIFAHVAFFLWAIKKDNLYLFFISATLLAGAWYFWDMTHLYLYVLAVFFIFQHFCWKKLFVFIMPILCIACINPYLRFHHAYIALPLMYLAGLILFDMICDLKKISMGKFAVAVRALIFLCIVILSLISGYAEDYNHFGTLFLSKLMFLNRKPLDPALLSFDVRVLWTPALHSASLTGILKYFGCIFFTGLVSIGILVRKKREIHVFEKYILCCFFLFSILYIFFVRIHVYTVFFGILMVLIWNRLERRHIRVAALIVLLLISLGEYDRTLGYREYMGRDIDYKSLNSLLQWINEYTDNESPILASFDLAGPILNYTERPIIVQPKFEKRKTRDIYKDFISYLFSDSEEGFYRFSQQHKAEYFVYEKACAWNRSIYSSAYFAAVSSKRVPNTLAARFDGMTKTLHRFTPVYENSSYRVFKIVSQQETELAEVFFNKAQNYMDTGDYRTAETLYRKSIGLFPGYRKARMRLGTTLWLQGKKNEAQNQWRYARFIRQE